VVYKVNEELTLFSGLEG